MSLERKCTCIDKDIRTVAKAVDVIKRYETVHYLPSKAHTSDVEKRVQCRCAKYVHHWIYAEMQLAVHSITMASWVIMKFDDYFFYKLIPLFQGGCCKFYLVCGDPILFLIVIHWLNDRCCLVLSTSYKAIRFTDYLF